MGLLDRAVGGLMGGTSRPSAPPDLQPWAAEKGLAFEGVRAVPGIYTGISLDDSEARANVMSGELPGGEMGSIGHERIITGHSSGTSSQAHYTTITRIAVRVPEAIGPLQRFALTNTATFGKLRPKGDGDDEKVNMKELGFTGGMGWSMTLARGADRALMQELLTGDFGAHLQALPGTIGLELCHGSLVLTCADGYLSGDGLVNRCKNLCALAQILRQACLAKASPQPWETELPEPGWVATAPDSGQAPATKQVLGMTIRVGGRGSGIGDDASGLDQPLIEPWRTAILTLAQQGGGAIEDALAFHRAFPEMPVPGNAFAVVRAPSPEAGVTRIVLYHEGVITHGPVSVMCRVKPSTEDRPAPIGGERDALRIAVKDGVMAGWRHRAETFNTSEIPPLAQQIWDYAAGEGWVPA